MSINMSIEWSKITIIAYLTLAWTIEKLTLKMQVEVIVR